MTEVNGNVTEPSKVEGPLSPMTLIAEAVNPACAGCSTTEFAPQRLGPLVLKGIISLEDAIAWAASCTTGFTPDQIPPCHHYPPSKDT